MCVCVHIFKYRYIYSCMHACIQVCICACVVCTHACMHVMCKCTNFGQRRLQVCKRPQTKGEAKRICKGKEGRQRI